MYLECRGGSRISGKGVHMYKGVLILSHFSFKNGGRGRGPSEPPEPPLDPPLECGSLMFGPYFVMYNSS